MRTSLVQGLVLAMGLTVFGTGCETIGGWFGLVPESKNPLVGTQIGTTPPPFEVGSTDSNGSGKSILDDDEKKYAQSFDKAPFGESRPLDAATKFAPVQFGYDSAVLPPQEVSKIEQVGQFMLGNSGRALVVEGHCDERGSNEYNLSLGEQRAQSVRKYLIDLGVDAARVQTRSFGEEKPVDPGHSEAAWARNRRGEFVVYK